LIIDCGQTHVLDDEVRRTVIARRPELAHEVENMPFGEITDMEGSVLEDIKVLKSTPLLPADMEVLGYVLDLETGLLREVKP
jgi:carbonic anhydrase